MSTFKLGDRVVTNIRTPYQYLVGQSGMIDEIRHTNAGVRYRVVFDKPVRDQTRPHMSPRSYIYLSALMLISEGASTQPAQTQAPTPSEIPQPAVVAEAPKMPKRMPPSFGRNDYLTLWELSELQHQG